MERISDRVTKGVTRAPHRSLFYAMGYTEEDLNRPIIGVVNAQNEIVPGHIHLDTITKAVKEAVWANGGTPVEFPAIAVCGSIAMNHVGMHYSLAARAYRRFGGGHGRPTPLTGWCSSQTATRWSGMLWRPPAQSVGHGERRADARGLVLRAKANLTGR